MTEAECIKVAVYVLHNQSEQHGVKLKAKDIVSFASDPNLSGFWRHHGIVIPNADDPEVHTYTAQFARRLGMHVNSNPSKKRLVDGNANGWKLGPKAGSILVDIMPGLELTVSARALGAAGEFAVMSELSALDWNVAKLALDDGVDVFASKGSDVRTIQVKTAKSHLLGDCSFSFSGSKIANQSYNAITHYYVLVFRVISGAGWKNHFFISPAHEFQSLLEILGNWGNDDKWSLSVSRKNHRFLMGGTKDITDQLDHFVRRFV